ncbi:MAG: AAA family ATPase [Agathobaculum sp.]|jgi:cytidylate kinase|uniref:AAA family ATPase n=1 Tax=Agathobaculum sp. TaxID=2048138 RepID=UPI003D91BD63
MKKIITISRQFGAGGGELGRRTARALGIPLYNKDLILRTAMASGDLTPEEVRRWDERVPVDFGLTQSLFDFYNRPLSDKLWEAQVKAIREMADKESCVIVGRNADYILREFDHCLRVFVHADFEWRLERMCGMMPDSTEEQVRANIRSVDKARNTYCTRYTGHRYADATNYDMTLCTSRLGIDAALEHILKAAEHI